MPEQCLPDQLTHIAPADLYARFDYDWQAQYLTAPARASLLVLLSHWAFETAFGRACHRFNLGNFKHVKGDGHDYVMVAQAEIIGGKRVIVQPPDPATWLRAYQDLDGGAADYFARLHKEFSSAWPFVVSGDVPGFGHALKLAHYYTDSEANYTAGLLRCYHQLDTTIPAASVA